MKNFPFYHSSNPFHYLHTPSLYMPLLNMIPMHFSCLKAYNTVPREAMWLILIMHSVPEKLVNLVKSFHEDMQAGISVDDSIAQVVVSNGLRQGCVLAPTLFVLFFNMVIRCWRDCCKHLGVKLLYKCSGKLVGERTRTLLKSWLTELCCCHQGPYKGHYF